MDDSIRLHLWFEPEEISLMGRCLEAVADGRFIDDPTIVTLTGLSVGTFQEVSDRFNNMAKPETNARLNAEDFEVIFQAVGQLSNYPVDNPDDLEPFLRTRQLHLGWFWYRLILLRDGWEDKVEEDKVRMTDEEFRALWAKDHT